MNYNTIYHLEFTCRFTLHRSSGGGKDNLKSTDENPNVIQAAHHEYLRDQYHNTPTRVYSAALKESHTLFVSKFLVQANREAYLALSCNECQKQTCVGPLQEDILMAHKNNQLYPSM